MSKVGYTMDQKKQSTLRKQTNFKLDDYLHEIDSVWNQVDFQGNKEITKNKFYRYLSDAKLLLNAEYSKTEEMMRQMMYSWGEVPEKPDPRQADATGT